MNGIALHHTKFSDTFQDRFSFKKILLAKIPDTFLLIEGSLEV